MNVQKNTKQKSAAAYDREKSAPLNREKFSSAGFFSTEALGFFSSFGQRAPLNWKKYAEHIFIHNPRFLTAALLLCFAQCTGARFNDAAPSCDVISGNVWEAKESGTEEGLTSVAVLGERLIAVGESNTILTSDDKGESWTPQMSGTPIHIKSVAVLGERLIAVGNVSTGMIITSDDRGESWTDRTPAGVTEDIGSVAVSEEGTLIAVGTSGLILKSTDDGATWDPRPGSGGAYFNSVIFSQGSFLAFGTVSNIYESTDDGDSWTALSTREAPDPSFPDIGLIDEDTGMPLRTRSFLGALAMAGRLIVVGGLGAVITSGDNGASWDIQASGATGEPDLWSVSGIGSRLVMVGHDGTILTSDDEGHSLMPRESGTTEIIRSVLGLGVGLGCYFIAVGSNGTVLVSKE